jgi:lysozyme
MARKPPSQLRLSDPGRDVLADREGMRLEAYQDTVGVWTIGLGHTSAAGPPEVYEGMTITEDEAWEIFYDDCESFRKDARALVVVPVEQYEYDATASFIYNIGTAQFMGSTFLDRLNAGDYAGAAEAMLWWDVPPEVMSRRRGEHAQFSEGRYVARIDENGNAT